MRGGGGRLCTLYLSTLNLQLCSTAPNINHFCFTTANLQLYCFTVQPRMSSSSKRKRKCLSIQDKLKILDDLETGVSYAIIQERYGIGKSTVGDIKAKKEEIIAYKNRLNDEGQSASAKKVKSGTDEAVYLWFCQQREKGNPVSGPILQTKAKQLNALIYPDGKNFDASCEWQHRFCKRHSIRQLTMTGESVSCNREAAEKFVATLAATIKEEAYTQDQIFNCDETSLYFRMLPNKTLTSHKERPAAGRKKQMERVTLNICANASGTSKLPLHIIGKSIKPRCFKNCNMETIPIRYSAQKNSWMTSPIFKSWFHELFVPHIKHKLSAIGQPEKAILLLDNCSAHPDESQLMSGDDNIKACFLRRTSQLLYCRWTKVS